ncbi:hypothetical protein SSX86_019230 [Deinandra increscens subsp. villosa]|uniref:procollagen-proline 4-dioxygenase n=1 Tax=Deinandra increscens subsp. villosa TaxID=3103831 RepID=A0AAP0CTV0_9ASTR
MGPKGRLQPRGSSRKSSSSTLIFSMLIICLFFILILLALGILSIPSNSTNSPKPHDLNSIVQQSEEECEHLIKAAKPHMVKSTVVDSVTGKSKDSRVRTSSGTFLKRGQDETVQAIEKRISEFTFLPVENGEGLQILHYEIGQKYESHYDYFLDEYNTRNGGQRMATVLMYLSDVEEGGETVFPSAKGNISAVPWWDELSECGKKGLSVKPKMGDALLFWNMRPDATPDPSSMHGGCPVIKGNKWSSTKWIRVNEFRLLVILIFLMWIISLFSALVLLALEVYSVPSYLSNIHYDLATIVQQVTNDGRRDDCNGRVDRSVEVISWEPRAVIYHNFLSKEECEHIIDISKPHMKKSTIIDKMKGEIEDTFFRTGYITSLDRGQDETVRSIEKRIADFTFLPFENGDGFEVLRYEVGQKFLPHPDYFIGDYGTDSGGLTVATVVLYLSDVEEGGETVFPLAMGNISDLPCWNGEYRRDKPGGLSVKPKMGDALLFWNVRPDGDPDSSSIHGGCPVIKGNKWVATKWIHLKESKV